MAHIDHAAWEQATAETIRAERAAANLSQSAAADRAGLSRTSFIRYETGERKPNLVQVAAIAGAFGLPVSVFIRRVEERARLH